MNKFQRKLAEKMGEETMTISVKDWDELNDKVEFLKNQNFDIDKYAERLQKEVEHYKKYATHHPTCLKPQAMVDGIKVDVECNCGLDKI